METVSVPKEDYEEMLETIEVLSNNEILKDIKKSEEELKAGKFVKLKDLK